jgi:exosome complex component RRP41
LNNAIDGCKLVYEIQKDALMKKYFGNELEVKEEV